MTEKIITEQTKESQFCKTDNPHSEVANIDMNTTQEQQQAEEQQREDESVQEQRRERQAEIDKVQYQKADDAIDFEMLKEYCSYSPEKPRRIGGLRDLKKYLESMGLKTREDLQSEIDNCLVIIKRGNVYYDDTRC